MNVRDTVTNLVKKHRTRNPFDILKGMNVIVLFVPLIDIRGFYQYFQRNNIIYINEDLSDIEKIFVCAHELGHMLMHKQANCLYMDTHTNFNTNKYEIEANKFAMELLLPDAELHQYPDLTLDQLSRMFGYSKSLLELRLK